MTARFTQREAAAWGGLLRTYARLDRAIDADLARHDGISHVEFEVLLRLRRAPDGRMRIQDLAADSLLTRSGISRLVNRLATAGLLDRASANEDGRGSYAVLTEAGRSLFEKAAQRHIAFVRERFHTRLSAADLDALTAIWAKLADD